MNKNFNISNYNLDLIKCLQNESGIYFILDPTKAIHDKKNSDVYDIFIPENSDGVTLHVQKVNNEYKCIGVSITKRGIDINTGTRIFNTKIADWLEQLFNFNKSLGSNNNGSANANSNNNENDDGNNNWSNMERNGGNNNEYGIIVNNKNTSINANPINNIGGANNEQGNASDDDKDPNDGDGNDNPDNSDDHNNSIINNGNNKYNNYNNVRHNLSNNQTGVPITNLIKNSKGGYDNFENNDNYNNAINMPNKSKNSKNPINQGNCNLNVNNNLSTHIIPSSNLSSSQSKKQNQHTKQIRLNQMNNSHKSHLLQYHNSNYDDKNSKLYNNTVINKHISSENAGAAHASNNNDTVKGNKIGCNTRQKNSPHSLHNGTNNSNKGQQQAYNENLGYRPTLFNLLEVLSNHNITTPDQRVCIRGIVTDFLNNELPHGKIYAYIGAVVGHDILHDIIKKLEKDPNRNAVPDASGLARIEASFGLSKSSYDFMNHNSTNSSMNNIPNVLFNNRNLNSALLNNHIYSNILSNVANNNGNIGDNMGHSGMLNTDNEKISNNKTANDINNMMMKYGDNDKLGGSYNNNMLNINKKKALNMLNMRYMDNNIADMANLGINNMNSTDNNYMSQMNIDLANLENLNNAKNSGLSMQEYLYASKNLHNVNSLNRNSNITEDEEELMKVIKKNIETYKMNNIKNILISSVFGRIKWLKIMNESPHAYLYGHSIVKYGNKLYMFGGTNNKHKKVPFNHTLTFSLIYYNYKLLPLSGNYPEERDGHTTHLVSLKSGLSVFLFGGANNNIYYNDIYILDMETRKWSKRIVNGKIPLPRHQHCSLVYPAKSEHLRGEKLNLTEGVIVYGGKCLYNNNIVNLNDMWIFLFETNMWVRINYLGDQVPIGRYGMNLIWSDTNTLCLFGGEYLYSDKTCKTRKLLDDMWTFRLNTPILTNNIEDTNTDIKYPSYENAVNAQDDLHKHQKGIKQDPYINNVNENNGMASHDNDNDQTDNLHDQNEANEMDTKMGNNNNESQGVDNKDVENSNNLANKIKITGEWKREIYEGNIGCRSNYSSIFITQRHQDFKGAEPKTIEKLMLLCSGITYDNKLKIVSSDEIYVYFFSQKRWYLLKGKLYNEEYMYNARQRHVGCFFESKNVLGRSNRNPVPCIFIHGGFKKNSVFGDAWLLSLTGENPLRLYEYDTCREKISTTQMPLYYFRDTHSISLLYTFCTLQKWLFGAFANLVDNSVYAINPAENVFIKYELTPEHDGMISIQDDGEGLDFNAMNRILRMYGNYKNYDNNSFYNNNNNNNIKKHSLPNNDDSDSHEIDNYDDNEDEQEYNEETNNTNDANNNENNADQNNDQYDNNNNTGFGNNVTDEMQQNAENEEGADGEKSYNNNLSEGQNGEGIIKKENDIRNKNGPIGKKKCTWNDTFYYKRKNQYYFYNDLSNSIFDIKYGVGFKTAFARIASSCAIMSRTINTIGIGLLSLELMNHCDAKELATPLCMWKLPNKELINRNIANKSEHRHHQKLLMSYTPFNSPSLLAEQINILGTYSGTRLLYWNFRDDMDFVIFNPTNNNIYLSSAPLSIDELKSKNKKRKNGQGEESNINSKYQGVKDIKFANRIIKRKGVFGEDGNLKKFKADADNPDEEGDDENDKYNNVDDNYNKEEENIKKEHDNMSTSSKNNNIPDDNNDENKNGNSLNYKEKMKYEDQLKYNNNNYFKKRMNLFEYNSHLSPSISKEKYNMNDMFPLWDHPKDSIDYCLSTYLYWLYLRRSTNIFLQNTLLIPTSMRREKDIIANKNNNDTKGKKKKKSSKLRNKNNNKQNNANNQSEEQADATNNQENDQIASNEENNGDIGNTSETAAENNKSEQEYENNDDNNHSDAQNEDNINNEEGETSEQNENDDIKNENDGTNKDEGEKEENNNANDGKEKDNCENDPNAGLSKLEKQKLEEALEYGIPQDAQAQNSANKNDTDDEDEEEEEEEEEDEEEEEEDEDVEEENEEAPKNDEDNDNINETNNEGENEGNNNVENEGAEVEGEANEGDEVGEDGVVKTEPQNEMENENNIEEEDGTEKNKKVKNEKNKIGKTIDDPNEDSIASRRKRRRKKDDLAAGAGANGKKNGEIEKMKKENYVNVYMENFKIKDEYYINNPSRYTLYHFLRRKLYKMVESHYLFTPADHTYGSFIMMGFLNDNNNTSMEVNRVCETGILLYYKNRLIKRLDAPFIDTPYNLFLSKYPPSPSLYEGNLYKYALTVIVNVPNWLKPSVSKQEFVHENNHAFLVFKKKLVTLIKHYLSICEDIVKLNKWRESRDLKLKRYLEKMQNQSVRSRNDSDYENDDDDNNKSKNYNIIYNDEEGDYMNDQNDGNKKKKEEINYSGRNKPSSYANDNEQALHKNKKTKTNNDDSNKRDQNPTSENESANLDNENNQENDNLDEEYDEMDQDAENRENYDDEKDEPEENEEEVEEDDPNDEEYNAEMDDQKNRSVDQETEEEMAEEDEEYEPGDD